MILPEPSDAIHKAWLYRLLSAITDDTLLVSLLRFKGGTCAAMRGFIDRFSVDLDFDLLDSQKMPLIRKHLEKTFKKLGLVISQQSQKVPQYFLKYNNRPDERNTIRLDVTFPPPISNDYEPVRFPDIDRILYCHTVETMFANKLVSITDRYQKHGSIAGRDLYDIHSFFLKGFRYKSEIIQERTGFPAPEYLQKLKDFIDQKFTQTIIDQDLNMLIPPSGFHKIRKLLKQETLMFLHADSYTLNESKHRS